MVHNNFYLTLKSSLVYEYSWNNFPPNQLLHYPKLRTQIGFNLLCQPNFKNTVDPAINDD